MRHDAADEIWVQKSAPFPTRLRLGLVVVVSGISPWFYFVESSFHICLKRCEKSEKKI